MGNGFYICLPVKCLYKLGFSDYSHNACYYNEMNPMRFNPFARIYSLHMLLLQRNKQWMFSQMSLLLTQWGCILGIAGACVMGIIPLSGCGNPSSPAMSQATSAFEQWHGRAAYMQEMLNLTFHTPPVMVGFVRTPGPSGHVSMMGLQHLSNSQARWVVMPQNENATEAGLTLQGQAPTLQANVLTQYPNLKTGRVKKWTTAEGQEAYGVDVGSRLQMVAFGGSASENLSFLNGQQAFNGFQLGRKTNTPWRAKEHLLPIIQETFQEFGALKSEQLLFVNMGQAVNQGAPSGTVTGFPPNLWLSGAVEKAVKSKSGGGLVQQHAQILADVPEFRLSNGQVLDGATMEYLYAGSDAAMFTPAPEVDYISVQHVNRYLKKFVLEGLSEDKQNQIKMMNPLLSLLHLNLEKDVLGLFSQRSLLAFDAAHRPALVLEPAPSKLKTIDALARFLGPQSPLNSGVLKGVGNGKDYLLKEEFKGRTLLALNPGLGLPGPLSELRVYPSDQGIYLAQRGYFTATTPDDLTRLMKFNTYQKTPTPWLEAHVPHLKPVLNALISQYAPLQPEARSKAQQQVDEMTVEQADIRLNLSTRNKRVISGAVNVLYRGDVACSPGARSTFLMADCTLNRWKEQMGWLQQLLPVVAASIPAPEERLVHGTR
jgi:hypothetical protein